MQASLAPAPGTPIFAALVEQVGRSLLYSNKRWYLGGLRFSTAGEKLIARELDRILDAQLVARKKCLLLDLDNTLWAASLVKTSSTGSSYQKPAREHVTGTSAP